MSDLESFMFALEITVDLDLIRIAIETGKLHELESKDQFALGAYLVATALPAMTELTGSEDTVFSAVKPLSTKFKIAIDNEGTQ